MPTNVQTGTLLAQTLDGIDGANNTNIIYGDAIKLKGNSEGGADTITGGDDGAINYIYGDAYSMEGKSKGGADYLIGGANGATNYIFGDAYSMKGKVVGGNDLLVGANGSKNIIYGDAYIIRDGAKGGDDNFYMDDGTAIFLPNLNARSFSGDSVSESQSAVFSIFGGSFIGDASTIHNGVGGKDNINLGNQIKVDLSNITAISNSFSSSLASAKSTVNLNFLSNTLLGDADLMRNSKGGDDIINAANSISINTGFISSSSNNNSVASAISLIDILLNDNVFVGDGSIMKKSTGGVDIINFSNDLKIIIGETLSFSGSAGSGGNSNTSAEICYSILDNFITGDAQFFFKSKGGNDIINIGNNIDFNVGNIKSLNSPSSSSFSSVSIDFSLSGNTVLGDSKLMSHSQGGDDVINVCNNFVSHYGAISNTNIAPTITPYSFVFTLTDNNLYGDAEFMIHSKGGDDQLSIGVGIFGDSPFTLNIFDNTLYGDAKTMKKSSGGNDILTGADGKGSITYLYGDAQFTDGKSKAGDDKLISGQGDDQMWGDFGSVVSPIVASNDHDDDDDDHESEHDDDNDHCSSNINKYDGKDTFVFAANNGKDTIFDFQRGLDKIELKGLAGFQAFSDLIYAPSATHSSDLVIDLGDGNSITLVGVNNLEASDFVFA